MGLTIHKFKSAQVTQNLNVTNQHIYSINGMI
jgi:hypothetical protein